MQTGDTVITLADRPVIMVDFGHVGDCNLYASPITIPGGSLRPEDHTGVVLPKGAKVKVRDVSIGHFPENPIYVVWLRIAYNKLETN
jgi:hypothetical protein